MSDAASPVPADHPLMLAWNAYKETEEFKNSKKWALTIAPMIQAGDPDAERKRFSLMPIEQRETHVDGSLWAAFMAGFAAAEELPRSEPGYNDTAFVPAR
jgi:hypothetical protein